MYTIQLEAPGNQEAGLKFVQTIESWRQNPNVLTDRKYLIYKEIVESDEIQMGVSNFYINIKTSDQQIALSLKDTLQGTLQ